MASKIIMPKLGMAMSEGVVAKWNKHDGDEVRKDEEIAVVMSKKITYKLIAPESGILRIVAREKETRSVGAVLAFIVALGEALPALEEVAAPAAAPAAGILRIVAREKETRSVGAALAFIVAPGEALPAVEEVAASSMAASVTASAPAAASVTAAAPAKPGFVLASPAARRLAKEKGIDLAQVAGTGADGMVTEADVLRFAEGRAKVGAPVEVLATSAARKLAEQRGLNLAEITGTGPGGRITEQDVLAYEARGKVPTPIESAQPAAHIIPYAGMRQAIGDHMIESLRSMAQLTMMIEVDATELVKLRTQVKADFDLTYTDLLIKAVAKTLKRNPVLNATLIGDEIHLLESIHIGVAVALPDGLIVPVVRNADQRTVQEIAQEVRRLAQGARDNTLSVDEVTGSTFTITNLGNYGVDGFTPIINAPEAAILGVGRITDKAVFEGDQVVKRSVMVLSLTIDHRIVDGAPGAEFLRSLKDLLETPYRLLT